MAEETMVEKHYCYDHPSAYKNNDGLIAALMSNKSSDPATMAAMMNSCNGWQNNPFMYLIWLAFFGGGAGFGYNRNGAQDQISTLQDTINSNHNNDLAMQAIKGNADAIGQLANAFNSDFNAMSLAVNGVRSAIDQVGGAIGLSSEKVINSILLGNKDLQSQIATCCCQNKELVQKMGYDNQLATVNQTNSIISRIDQLSNGISQGFSSVGYAAQQNTNNIIQAGNANTQKIVDLLTSHWQAETSQHLQDAKFEISQLKQNQYLGSLITGGCACGGNS